MKQKTLISCLAVFFLVFARGEVATGSDRSNGSDPRPGEGPVFVESTEILYLESFPVQVTLTVRGSLPTPCHETSWVVEDLGRSIEIRLWSEADPGRVCILVLEPFEISIPLGSFESSSSPVLLNGEQVGRLAIGAEPAIREMSLVGAGWSFGECGGYCNADLVIDGDVLILTGSGHILQEPVYVNRGALTALAQERIDAALERLDGAVIDPIYGCPDCADGGAVYLTLAQRGATSKHEMDFARPPDLLAEPYAIAIAIIDALETCVSDELVTVARGCQAWQGG